MAEVDIEAWAAFLERILRATERRVSDGDIEGLAVIARIQARVDETLANSVTRLRAEPWNYSWTDVGTQLGITRQAAQQRFGSKGIYLDEPGTTDSSLNQRIDSVFGGKVTYLQMDTDPKSLASPEP